MKQRSEWNMKNLRVVAIAAVLSACGSSDQLEGPGGSGDSAATAEGNSGAPKTGVVSGAPDASEVPARDEATGFAQRFAAVREIVGEDAAKRIMVTADRQAVPLYELVLSNGNSVEWYEILEGVAVAVESGSSPSSIEPELKLRKTSATQLFSALAPKAAPPLALVELDRRHLEMAPIYRRLNAAADRYAAIALAPLQSTLSDSVRPQQPVDDLLSTETVGKAQLGLSSTECFNQTIACSTHSVDWRVLQADRTSNSTISRSDTQSVVGIGCTQSGIVTYRMRHRTWFTWSTWFAHDVPAGSWVGPWHFFDNVLDFDIELRLYNFDAGDQASQCAAGHD
jgi:hypothetical protein